MTKEEEKVLDNALDKILDQLDDNTKNTLIKLLMTHDRKDIWIQSMPIYEDLMYRGQLLARYISGYKYAVGVKHDAAAYVDELKGDGKFDYDVAYTTKGWDEVRSFHKVHKSQLANIIEDGFINGGYDMSISCVER